MIPTHKRSATKAFPCFLLFLLLLFFIFLLLLLLSNRLHDPSQQINQSFNTLPLVIIDAGHGGEDGGAIGINGVYEKDINLSIAKKLDSLFRASGFQTVMTRTEDRLLYDPNTNHEGRKKALDMQARLNICRQYDSAIFISIHQNSFTQEKYSGLQVYYSENNASSKALAQTIQKLSAISVCPENNRKIKEAGNNIFLLNQLSLPAVLVECGFISNHKECELLSKESYQTQLAMLLYASVMDFFEQSSAFEPHSS